MKPASVGQFDSGSDSRQPAGPADASLAGTETILVVEDDPGVRQLIVRSLASHGYRVFGASHPHEALRLAASLEGGLDLLVTDVVMPHMSGKELADRLTAVRPTMRVLFISGYPQGLAEAGGPIPNDIAYLQKPFSPSTLAARVRDVLRK